MSIPTFQADGQRLRNRSVESIETLLTKGRVSVERNRCGRITKATFVAEPQASTAVQSSIRTGQRYSHQQSLPSGRRTWKFSALIPLEDVIGLEEAGISPAEADAFIRGIFLAVPKSVMQGRVAPSPATPSACRPARPVEFDSAARLEAA